MANDYVARNFNTITVFGVSDGNGESGWQGHCRNSAGGGDSQWRQMLNKGDALHKSRPLPPPPKSPLPVIDLVTPPITPTCLPDDARRFLSARALAEKEAQGKYRIQAETHVPCLVGHCTFHDYAFFMPFIEAHRALCQSMGSTMASGQSKGSTMASGQSHGYTVASGQSQNMDFGTDYCSGTANEIQNKINHFSEKLVRKRKEATCKKLEVRK